ncbi:hypothetical protein GCM10010492_72410 [Saccharothrix mutabilis subsp. mutabilis]|uniref:Uncharacterized protein n=1 Tax=Saccharothrix mutabilis subsp. mutabilis TaxID=66855 RepID=A0ABN0UTH1_9PSEU
MSLTPIYDDLLREFEGIIESILSGDTAAEADEAAAPEQADEAAN